MPDLDKQVKFEIAERIRECRIKKGLTQSEFSEGIDISINFLSEIENGRKGLSYETLYHLCKNYALSADYILFGDKPENNNYQTIVEVSNRLTDDEITILIKYLNALLELRKLKH